MITARFGDNWKEYANKTIDKELAIEIAWTQGRLAIKCEQKEEKIVKEIKRLFSRSENNKYDDGYNKAVSDVLNIFKNYQE